MLRRSILWSLGLFSVLVILFGAKFSDAGHFKTRSALAKINLPPVSQQLQPGSIPFCGMQFVSDSQDYEIVRDLGVTVVLQTFKHDDTPADWLAQLDELQEHNLQVIAVLWPQGWEWDGDTWQVDRQAQLFLETIASHPTTFAVFGLQEPYWRGCRGCGLTTSEQQALYQTIKAIADVPLYSELGDITYWVNHGQETTLAEAVCDYCGVWFYPTFADGSYHRREFITHLEDNTTLIRKLAPNAKLVWLLQAFARNDHRRMPTAEEIHDMGAIVAEREVDGVFWYVWHFGPLYSDFLSNHPELLPAVRSVPFCGGRASPSAVSVAPVETPPSNRPEPLQINNKGLVGRWGILAGLGILLLGGWLLLTRINRPYKSLIGKTACSMDKKIRG